MTPSLIDSAAGPGRDVRRAAALVATACVLQVAESLIPHPIPGVRLGLANMVTLVTLVELGMPAALEVAMLRTIVSSLVLGTFLTPGFMLSFFSAAASTLVMWGLWRVSIRLPSMGFSLIGISVASAVAHNAAQLGLAYLLMVRHPSIFYFAPWLAISGVVMGWLTGLVAAEVVRGQRRVLLPGPAAAAVPSAVPGYSFLHRMAPEHKILLACAVLLLAVFTGSAAGFAAIGAALAALMLATRLPAARYAWLFGRLRGLAWLASVSFVFPLLFSRGGDILLAAGPLTVTSQGLSSGSLFALRILVMGWTALLLNIYASPAEMAAGIARLGRPFGRFGFPAERIGAVVGLAWSELPALTERARVAVRSAMAEAGRDGWKGGPVSRAVKLAAGVVAGMSAPEGAEAASA